MKQFEYFSPKNVVETCALLKEFENDAQILAGGTDVLIELRKSSIKASKAIIDISRSNELKGINETESEIIIKPLTTHTEIGSSLIIKKHARLLHMAANVIGSPQIRNRGTIGIRKGAARVTDRSHNVIYLEIDHGVNGTAAIGRRNGVIRGHAHRHRGPG